MYNIILLRNMRNLCRFPVSSKFKQFHCGIQSFSYAKFDFDTKYIKENSKSYSSSSVKIGCASGFWGDTPTAGNQLIQYGNVDFIILDYLSEITMSLLAAAKTKNPELGYTPDFISHAVGPYISDIKRKGIRIISNAGGINPEGCALALKQVSKKAGIELKIGVVYGDNLLDRKAKFIGKHDIYTGIPLPQSITSINAYLGSEPIVKCLEKGADIVITGRCTDSALALAPLVHSFGWKNEDFDLLASGSLAGHLIECGTQVTGGIYTDWDKVQDWDNNGFPIAEVFKDGSMLITKPPNTGGLISRGTVSEQLLYEIGDPRAYILPDVVCDFSQVKIEEADNGVWVTGARGKPSTDSFKVCATYLDGFKATVVCCVSGYRTREKAHKTGEAILKRCRNIFQKLKIEDFRRTLIQVIGAEENYGPQSVIGSGPKDGALWISVHHNDKRALQIFAMEIASAGTGMAPGLCAVVSGRPKPTPLLRLHSSLIKKNEIEVGIKMNGDVEVLSNDNKNHVVADSYVYADQPVSKISQNLLRGNKKFTLRDLAYTRSGDKGDSCNVGVIARKPSYLPYIQEALSTEAVAKYFQHLFEEGEDPINLVKRYEVDGIHGLNFVLEKSLGGGGIASLRTDPQGKAYGQMLLDIEIDGMPDLLTLEQTSST